MRFFKEISQKMIFNPLENKFIWKSLKIPFIWYQIYGDSIFQWRVTWVFQFFSHVRFYVELASFSLERLHFFRMWSNYPRSFTWLPSLGRKNLTCNFRGQMQNLTCKKWAPLLKPHMCHFGNIDFYVKKCKIHDKLISTLPK